MTPQLTFDETGLPVLGDQKATIALASFNLPGLVGLLFTPVLKSISAKGTFTAAVASNPDGTYSLTENYTFSENIPFVPSAIKNGGGAKTITADEAADLAVLMPAGVSADFTLSFV